jgi:hypothetical protein
MANSLHVARMNGNQKASKALCGDSVNSKPHQVPLVRTRNGAQVPVVACQGWPPGTCNKCKQLVTARFNVKLPD